MRQSINEKQPARSRLFPCARTAGARFAGKLSLTGRERRAIELRVLATVTVENDAAALPAPGALGHVVGRIAVEQIRIGLLRERDSGRAENESGCESDIADHGHVS